MEGKAEGVEAHAFMEQTQAVHGSQTSGGAGFSASMSELSVQPSGVVVVSTNAANAVAPGRKGPASEVPQALHVQTSTQQLPPGTHPYGPQHAPPIRTSTDAWNDNMASLQMLHGPRTASGSAPVTQQVAMAITKTHMAHWAQHYSAWETYAAWCACNAHMVGAGPMPAQYPHFQAMLATGAPGAAGMMPHLMPATPGASYQYQLNPYAIQRTTSQRSPSNPATPSANTNPYAIRTTTPEHARMLPQWSPATAAGTPGPSKNNSMSVASAIAAKGVSMSSAATSAGMLGRSITATTGSSASQANTTMQTTMTAPPPPPPREPSQGKRSNRHARPGPVQMDQIPKQDEGMTALGVTAWVHHVFAMLAESRKAAPNNTPWTLKWYELPLPLDGYLIIAKSWSTSGYPEWTLERHKVMFDAMQSCFLTELYDRFERIEWEVSEEPEEEEKEPLKWPINWTETKNVITAKMIQVLES